VTALLLVLLALNPDPRQVEADRLFYAGRYDEARQLYETLAGESGNPAYLCNIGRCNARLGLYDIAIRNMGDCLTRAQLHPHKRVEYEARLRNLYVERQMMAAAPPGTLPPPEWVQPDGSPAPMLSPDQSSVPAGDGRIPIAATKPPPPRRSALPFVFGGVGIAALTAGVVFSVQAQSLSEQLEQRYEPAWEKKSRTANAGQVVSYLVAAGGFVLTYLTARGAF
jgi:hypothetical protein